MSKYNTWDRYLILPDVHGVFYDKPCFDTALRYGIDYNPKYIILLGDFIDFWRVSSFNRMPDMEEKITLRKEVEQAKELLSQIHKAFPRAKIIFIEGNHERRLRNYLIKNAKEVYDFVDIRDILKLDKFKVEYIESIGESKTASLKLTPHLEVGHFNKSNKHAGDAAKALVYDRFVSIVQAHTHKMAKRYITGSGSDFMAVECGCLCRKDVYTDMPNWQQGFCTIDINRRTKHFDVDIIKFIEEDDSKFFIRNNKEYYTNT